MNNIYGTHFNHLVLEKWAVIVEREHSIYESPYAVLVFNTDELMVCTHPIHNRTHALRPQVDADHPDGVYSKQWSGTFRTWWTINYVIPNLWEMLVERIEESQTTDRGDILTKDEFDRNRRYF